MEWSNIRSNGRCAYYSADHCRSFLKAYERPCTRLTFDEFPINKNARIQPICDDLVALVKSKETDREMAEILIKKLVGTSKARDGPLSRQYWLSQFELSRLLVMSNCDFALYLKCSENLVRLQWISNSDIRSENMNDETKKFSFSDLYFG